MPSPATPDPGTPKSADPSSAAPRSASRRLAGPRLDLAGIATRLAAQRDRWEPLVAFDPVSRFYARLAAEPTFEAWLLTWVPGQGTDWHDHGGSAGAFVTLQGTLTEEHASVSPLGVPRIVPAARQLTAGTVRSFGSRHVHRVTNHSLEPAVSLHVYSPALVEMNAYAAEDGQLRLLRSQLVGVDW